VLKRSFDSVDEDGSGRVDSVEVLNAFRKMGLATTEADVAKMMASVDEGGQLAALVAQVDRLRHVEEQLRSGGLGLKEKEKAQLERLEARMLHLRELLDIDEEGAFGFEAYRLMVKYNDQQPHSLQLPRMVPMLQTVARVGCSQLSFKSVPATEWVESYRQQPRLLERVREISR